MDLHLEELSADEIGLLRLTPDDWRAMFCRQNAAREKIVFVSSAGMSQDQFDSHGAPTLGEPAAAASPQRSRNALWRTR